MGSSKKKIYLAVIGLGLLGLLIDRFVLSDSSKPKSASGAAVKRPHRATVPLKEAAAPALQLEVARFPAELPPAEVSSTRRDPFSLTDKLMMKLAPPPPVEETKSAHPEKPSRDEFAARHRLSAVMRLDEVWVAIIDDLMIAQGHTVDDCEVVGIDDHSAQFSCWDGEVDLAIENPLAQAYSK